jgi:hypothetical protein
MLDTKGPRSPNISITFCVAPQLKHLERCERIQCTPRCSYILDLDGYAWKVTLTPLDSVEILFIRATRD